MATISSDALVSTIQSEIQRVQDDLLGVEENLKRLTGRDFNEQRGERRVRQISTGEREAEPPPKRRPPGGVFARLGDPVTDPPRGRRVREVLEDGEIPRQKPSVASSVARPINDGKSRTEAAAELTRDRASRDRNRRMFGALLGTLQRFRTEEAKQKGKEEQRAKIEKKLEEKGRAEKEELRKERLELINQRKERQLRIERLNFKIERVKEHEAWEAGQRRLGKFIQTKSTPRLFWLPKINNSRTSSLISQTKHVIERELEEKRLRLKDELDEVLGGRVNYSFKPDVQEREPEVDNEDYNKDFNNGSDLLDYDAEEGELVYDDLLLSGKQKQKGVGGGRRVVVQVDSDVNRAPQRRVELVTVVAERGRRVKDVEGNESEKENVKSKVNVERKKVTENGGDKGRGKEKEKKKEKEKEKSRVKEKRSDKKTSPEKQNKSKSSKDSSSKKESKISKKDKKEADKAKEVESENLTDFQDVQPQHDSEPDDKSDDKSDNEKAASDANITNEEENSIPGTEDLSQISLPLDPEPETTPQITEVVVQHVPLNGNDDNQNAEEQEMQVETVLLDTSQIKQDKTEWDDNFPPLPIVIKKEKDATPERTIEEKREVATKPNDENIQRKENDKSSESSDSDSDSSEESEEEDEEESSSEDSSSESSSSSDEEDKKKKRKDKEKERSKKKESSSSSESSESDDSESDSDSSSSDDDRKRRKKVVEKRKPSPKYSRRSEREKESDRKKVERKKDTRKSRSRSRSRNRRSRSKDRRRVRSRSRDRRRDRR